MSKKPKLVLKPSRLLAAGRGLFTRETLPPGTFLGEYVGKITDEVSDSESDYAFEVADGKTLVPAEDCLLQYINDIIDVDASLNQGTRINHPCVYNCESFGSKHKIYIRTIAHISAGCELYFDYGTDYWQYRMRELAKATGQEWNSSL